MNPREVLELQLWLVSHEMSTSGSPTEQFEICVYGAYFRGIWIPECGGRVTDRHTLDQLRSLSATASVFCFDRCGPCNNYAILFPVACHPAVGT